MMANNNTRGPWIASHHGNISLIEFVKVCNILVCPV